MTYLPVRKTFKREYLLDVLRTPEWIVSDEIVDHRRWSMGHRLLFRHDGRVYETSYWIGATEMQDESPWDYADEVTCVEVHEVEIVSKKWVPVEET